GNRANGNSRPASYRLRQARRFAWQLDPCPLTESEGANVFIEPLVAEPQRHFDGANVARLRNNIGDREHSMRPAVADAHAIDDNRSHLAVKHFVRSRNLLFQSGGDSHHLESRSGLVNIAHGAIFQSVVLNFLPNIRIECGPVGERQNLAGVRILHDRRAGNGVRLFHPALQFPFGNVLDVLIDGEDDAIAGFGLLFHTGKPALARVDRNHQLAGLALQLLVELSLQAAQALIVGANVAQNLRRQFSLGIKALGFLLVVDTLQIQRADALNRFGVGLARHPAKGLVRAAVSEHNARIVLRNARYQADSIGQVGSFR